MSDRFEIDARQKGQPVVVDVEIVNDEQGQPGHVHVWSIGPATVERPSASTEWREFDYDRRYEMAPPPGEMVWIVETFYADGVTIGVYDGTTFRVLPSGSDDCSVSHWAPMSFPPTP